MKNNTRGASFEAPLVFPKGFEPPSSEPESDILSIELRERIFFLYISIYLTTKTVIFLYVFSLIEIPSGFKPPSLEPESGGLAYRILSIELRRQLLL